MTSDAPGPGTPGPDEPTQGSADDSPTEAVPPAAPTWGAPPAPADTPAAPAQPPATQWGAPPAAAPLDAPPPAAPLDAPPPSTPSPGGPAAEPAAPHWGAAAAASATPPPAGPPGQPPAGAPGQPPTQPAQWGAPPPQQPPPTWGPAAAPGGAPQQPGWGPAPGAPGGPPTGTWNPQPATKSNNGCLKACLILAVIGIILAVVAVVGFGLLANQFVSDLGVDPNTGEVKQCELITGAEIDQVFGGTGAEVIPLGGLIDVTVGAVLDKRVLKDANDCWILTSGTSTSVTGRIARAESLNASGDFQAAKAAATQGTYFGGDVPGLGDEAFCTGASQQSPSFGVLVRSGGSLVYVSLIDPGFASQGDWETTDEGVLISPETCALAGEVAAAVLR